MRIHVNDPAALDVLAMALSAGGCLVERTSRGALEVAPVPELFDEEGERRQLELELRFFLRAWGNYFPGVHAILVP
jgi:hypothetical protein